MKLQNAVAFLVLLASASAYGSSQTLDVRIVDRQTNDTNYSYIVPGTVWTQSNANGNCFGGAGSANCSASATTTATVTPPRQVSFSVRGATFSLLLPDGRIAVVNCESKFKERFAGPAGNRRSCRMPLVNDIKAEFDGNKAKLIWTVSIDGKKTESETYNILGVLNKP